MDFILCTLESRGSFINDASQIEITIRKSRDRVLYYLITLDIPTPVSKLWTVPQCTKPQLTLSSLAPRNIAVFYSLETYLTVCCTRDLQTPCSLENYIWGDLWKYHESTGIGSWMSNVGEPKASTEGGWSLVI